MTSITFIRENGEALPINTGADKITWNYGLNTQTYPTYGGEVVQILSAYIDDITIAGTCRNYAQMQDIYGFFLGHIQQATQQGKFDQRPMMMQFPSRGWNISIQPKSVPGFRLATQVVAPEWMITAQVVESDWDMNKLLVDEAQSGFIAQSLNELTQLADGIGFVPDNPFSSPNGNKYDAKTVNEAMSKIGDWWGTLIQPWMQSDPAGLKKELFSKPEFLVGSKNVNVLADPAPKKK